MERKLIGRVGVDSGQLLIIDPCYIEDHWTKSKEGYNIGVEFWGGGELKAVDYLKDKGYHVEKLPQSYFISSESQQVTDKIKEDIREFRGIGKGTVYYDDVDSGSYNEVCQLTASKERAGQFQNIVGCAFSSGFGDGEYDIYATYKNMGSRNHVDQRITKVEIILIED